MADTSSSSTGSFIGVEISLCRDFTMDYVRCKMSESISKVHLYINLYVVYSEISAKTKI